MNIKNNFVLNKTETASKRFTDMSHDFSMCFLYSELKVSSLGLHLKCSKRLREAPELGGQIPGSDVSKEK